MMRTISNMRKSLNHPGKSITKISKNTEESSLVFNEAVNPTTLKKQNIYQEISISITKRYNI